MFLNFQMMGVLIEKTLVYIFSKSQVCEVSLRINAKNTYRLFNVLDWLWNVYEGAETAEI